ncbi:hypothetical protein FOXYSP1_06644 [Fusarium oxysporum f. sp. phaseoli]
MQILPLIFHQRTHAGQSARYVVKPMYDLRATDVAPAKPINMQPRETWGKFCIWEHFDYGMAQMFYILCNTPGHFANRTQETAPRSYTSQHQQIVCQHEARIAGSFKAWHFA